MSEKYLESYQKAINLIDDYFEYRFESQKDKEFVMGVIDRLTKSLENENNSDRQK